MKEASKLIRRFFHASFIVLPFFLFSVFNRDKARNKLRVADDWMSANFFDPFVEQCFSTIDEILVESPVLLLFRKTRKKGNWELLFQSSCKPVEMLVSTKMVKNK